MMDLTPLEVRKKKGDFRRQIRGYDPESVDDFLDLVADRLEQLVRENASLVESSTRLGQEVGQWKEREKALTEALVSAQQMREEMRTRAQQDAHAARTEAEKYAEEHREKAAHEAEESRREAQATLQLAKDQAKRELEEARATARRELGEARATARTALEEARQTAEGELERIRVELERIRTREQDTIRQVQERRSQLVSQYRSLLEQERSDLENLAAERSESGGDMLSPMPELPSLSPALLAAIEAAQEDVELSWQDAAEAVASFAARAGETIPDAADRDGPAAPGAVDPATPAVDGPPVTPDDVLPEWAAGEGGSTVVSEDELVLENEGAEAAAGPVEDPGEAELVLEEAEDDDSWLSSLVADSESRPSTPPAAPNSSVEKAAIEAAVEAESDEDFIDTLIANAGVAPSRRNGAGTPPPAPAKKPAADANDRSDSEFLGDLLRAELDEPAAPKAPAPEPAPAGQGLRLEEVDPTEGFDELDIEPITAGPTAVDPAAGEIELEDEDFDALFEDADDDPATFDFDAALANATGVAGGPDADKSADREATFDLGVEFDDASPFDLGRGGAGAFEVDDVGRAGFEPSHPRQPGLTLRPLSPEEEVPDLPIESRRQEEEEGDDDMFSTMFGGR